MPAPAPTPAAQRLDEVADPVCAAAEARDLALVRMVCLGQVDDAIRDLPPRRSALPRH